MRKFARLAAFAPIALSSYYWFDYYLPIDVEQFYHLMYFLLTIVPAVLLSITLLIATLRRRWLQIMAGVLSIPTLLLWLFSISLVIADFKIH